MRSHGARTPALRSALHELAVAAARTSTPRADPGLRYGSSILDRLPDGTILYAAIPNCTASLLTAKQVFDEHIAQAKSFRLGGTST
jgi:hypothetical protein